MDWQSRTHFFALASRMMRRILVDHARARAAAKRPDEALRVELEGDLASVDPRGCDVLLLDQALTELAHLDERQGLIVELVTSAASPKRSPPPPCRSRDPPSHES